MRLIKFLFINILALQLIACASNKPQTDQAAATPAALDEIASFEFDINKQLPLDLVKRNESPQGSLYYQWNVKGNNDNDSPLRIIYQKIKPATTAEKLMQQVLQPFKQRCLDSQITGFTLPNSYPQQLGLEFICSKFGKATYGSLMQILIMSDKNANHLLFTEVKTISSARAGLLQPQTAAQAQSVQVSTKLIALMQELLKSVQVCNSKQQCQ